MYELFIDQVIRWFSKYIWNGKAEREVISADVMAAKNGHCKHQKKNNAMTRTSVIISKLNFRETCHKREL